MSSNRLQHCSCMWVVVLGMITVLWRRIIASAPTSCDAVATAATTTASFYSAFGVVVRRRHRSHRSRHRPWLEHSWQPLQPFQTWNRGGLVFTFLSPRIRGLAASSSSSSIFQQSSTSTNVKVPRDDEVWKGVSHSSSSFASHVLIQPDESPIALVNVVDRILTNLRQQQLHRNVEVDNDKSPQGADGAVTDLSAAALIELGSVWYLPASAPRDPAAGVKPTRVTIVQMPLYTGDYVRIHHDPRRFRAVYDYDWSTTYGTSTHTSSNSSGDPTSTTTHSTKPGVIVASNAQKGWLVINKPASVPVHMTVDNAVENVAACLHQAAAAAVALQHQEQQDNTGNATTTRPDSIYVATPQRLDQNTSGLLVVATSKLFAAYFAQLLRTKTEEQLRLENNASPNRISTEDKSGNNNARIGGVHKLYKCLVCVLPPLNEESSNLDDATTSSLLPVRPPPWSVQTAVAELQAYVTNDYVMRHYLEPSIRAPKRFVADLPPDHVTCTTTSSATNNISTPTAGSTKLAAQWAEALLKIRRVSPVYALVGSEAAHQLQQSLQASSDIPQSCLAVLELEIELLTGRTHQIRGQLAACRFPLVGDVQYGGAQDSHHPEQSQQQEQRLALQCCALEFLDPDVVVDDDDDDEANGEASPMIRSDRWNCFRIDQAWWTPMLETYNVQQQNVSSDQATTSDRDNIATSAATAQSSSASPLLQTAPRPDLLPPRVSLSPGKHKYVLIRAVHPSTPDTVEWFVKSAAPNECGGPYHGHVAQDLREWISAAGYDVTVTGGGRIDYNHSVQQTDGSAAEMGRAKVYGFSYGFGKGDHEKAATVISNWSQGNIVATVDNSPGLY